MPDFLNALLAADTDLFYLVNLSFSSSFGDHLMVWITTKSNWYIPGGMLWFWLVWRGGKKGRILAGLVVMGIILGDQISSAIMKPGIGRLRPCKLLEGFRLLVHCGSKYGFPSSHATNIAAVGTLFMGFYHRSWVFWAPLIFLIGVSRIYVGVHYPLDVLGGWILGAGIAIFLLWVIKRLGNRYAGLDWQKAKQLTPGPG